MTNAQAARHAAAKKIAAERAAEADDYRAETARLLAADAARSPEQAALQAAHRSFTMNSKTYRTDAETATVLRSAVKSYREAGSNDTSAVAAVMALGLRTGRIQEAA